MLALGSRILFDEEFELGYRLTNGFGISVFLDHISNGDLAHHNDQSRHARRNLLLVVATLIAGACAGPAVPQ